MKFGVTGFELTVQNADPATAAQRIFAIHDRPAEHPAPQLLLTVSGPDIYQYLKKGDVLELSVVGEEDGKRA